MTDPSDIANGGEGWLTGRCECRICMREHVGVWPVDADEENLECPNCENMSSEAISYIKPNGEEVRVDGSEGEEWRGF